VRKPRQSEFDFQQQVFLGGEVSEKDSFYKDYAMLSPDDAFVLWFLQHEDELNQGTPKEAIIEITKAIAQFEYLKQVSELSQLSMKLGDTRKRLSARGLRDSLRILENARTQSS
jgi:hypothetical protein